jgi:parallel beta-helix repeat protein
MSGCAVTGNVATNAGGAGLTLNTVNDSTVTGNNVRDAASHGFFIAGSSHNVITGNKTESSVGSGYEITEAGIVPSTFNSLTGNFSKGDANGFTEDEASTDNNTFTGNRVVDTAGVAFRRTGGAGANSIYNNIPLYGEVTFDPPSLADGEGVSANITVTGAAQGDRVEGSFSNNIGGMTLTFAITTSNTVRARFENDSGVTSDLTSGTLRAWVVKR